MFELRIRLTKCHLIIYECIRRYLFDINDKYLIQRAHEAEMAEPVSWLSNGQEDQDMRVLEYSRSNRLLSSGHNQPAIQ